jgi:hypothetical protein
MSVVEENMQKYFEIMNKDKKEKQKEEVKKKEQTNYQEPIKIAVSEDEPIKDIKLKIPFAFVSIISTGSPAEEAGLKQGDGILRFDNVEYGKFKDPLVKIAEIIKVKKDTEIILEVLRKSENNENYSYLNMKLIPHVWDGQGLLG